MSCPQHSRSHGNKRNFGCISRFVFSQLTNSKQMYDIFYIG